MANKRKQIAFDIYPELHRLIKIAAAKENKSMSLWIQNVIVKALNLKEVSHDNNNRLE